MEFLGDYGTIGDYFQNTPAKNKASSATNFDSLNSNVEQQNSIFSQITGLFASSNNANKSVLAEDYKYQSQIGKILDKFANLIKEKVASNPATASITDSLPNPGFGKFGRLASSAASTIALGSSLPNFIERVPTANAQVATTTGVAPTPSEETASGISEPSEANTDNKAIASIAKTASGIWQNIADTADNTFSDLLHLFPSVESLISKVKAGFADLSKFAGQLRDKLAGLAGSAINSVEKHLPSLDDVKSGVNKAVDAVSEVGHRVFNAVTGTNSVNREQAEGFLNKALDEQNVKDPTLRAGIAAVSLGESGFAPKSEQDYSTTSNERIRTIFRSKLGDKSDQEISAIKSDPKRFFNAVYDGVNGNKAADDGYNYRGRGLNQLTGRGNYERIGQAIGVDLVNNPDLANDPEVAAKIAVAYSKERYHGGGFAEIKRGVGNPVASTVVKEDAAFNDYMQSGKFNAGQTPANLATAMPASNATSPNPSPIMANSDTPLVNRAIASNDRPMPIATPSLPSKNAAITDISQADAADDTDADDNDDNNQPITQINMPNVAPKNIFDDLGLGVNDIPLHINSNGVIVVGSSALY